MPTPPTLLQALHGAVQSEPDHGYHFLDAAGDVVANLPFRALDHQARRIAAHLQTLGHPKGARFLLLYADLPGFVAAFYGVAVGGYVPVPVPAPHPARMARQLARLQAVVHDAGTVAVLTTDAIARQLGALGESAPGLTRLPWIATDTLTDDPGAWADPGLAPDDLALLQYTSGSTGRPKGVAISHRSLLQNMHDLSEFMGVAGQHRMLSWLPVYHDLGLVGGMLTPMLDSGHIFMMSPMEFLRRPAVWMQAIHRHRANVTGGPNFAYELAAARTSDAELEGLDLSCLVTAMCGAEPIRPATIRRFHRRFAPHGLAPTVVRGTWGMAEATLGVSGDPPRPPHFVHLDPDALGDGQVVRVPEGTGHALMSCGLVRGDIQLRVVDADGRPSPADRIGEFWLKGTALGAGYWDHATARPVPFDDHLADGSGGWFRTGDLGFLDTDGSVIVTGRAKDMLIVRGHNHYPQDLEYTAESRRPTVRAGGSAAVGLIVDGEERVAMAVEFDPRKAPPDVDLEQETRALRRAVLEGHDVQLHAVAWLPKGTLPKTPSGKVMRSRVRAAFAADAFGGALHSWRARDASLPLDLEPGSDAPAILHALRQWVADRLEIDVAEDARVRDLGLDSLQLVQLTEVLRAGLGQPTLAPALLLDAVDLTDAAQRLAALPPHEPRGITPPPITRQARVIPHADSVSFWQQAIVAWEQRRPPASTWVELYRFHVSGPLQLAALRRALADLVRRHDALSLHVDGQGIGRHRVPVEHFVVQTADLSTRTKAQVDRHIEALAHQPMPLTGAPLLEVHAWKVADGHILVIRWHQLVQDGTGGPRLANELLAFYRGAVDGVPPTLPDLPLRYTDFASWERTYYAGKGAPRVQAARDRLSSMPPMRLPGDEGAAPATYGIGTDVVVEAPASRRFFASLEAAQLPFYTAIGAISAIVLARFAAVEDVTFVSPVSTRTRSELLPMVGRFGAWVPMHLVVREGLPMEELLASLDAQRSELDDPVPGPLLFGHDDPFVHPAAQVILNTPSPDGAQALVSPVGELQLTPEPLYKPLTSRSELSLVFLPNLGHLIGRISGNPGRFAPADIDRLVQLFQEEFARFDPSGRVSLRPPERAPIIDLRRPPIEVPSIPRFMRGQPMDHVSARAPRLVATEEAFATDELVERYLRLAPDAVDAVDMQLFDLIFSGRPLGRYLTQQLLDLDELRLAAMDEAGIDMAVLSLVAPGVQVLPSGTAHEVAVRANDALGARIALHPTRFAGLAAIDPFDPRAADEIRRAVGELGLRGVVINSHTRGRYLDAPEARPVLEALNTLRVPLYLHPRNPPGANPGLMLDNGGRITDVMWGFHAEAGQHAARLIVSGVLDELPDLRILLGHLGEGLPMLLFRMDWTARINYGLARRPSETFRHHFRVTTSGLFDDPTAHEALLLCHRLLGPEHILFAADHPFARGAEAAAALWSSPLDDASLDAIAWRNAHQLFGFDTP